MFEPLLPIAIFAGISILAAFYAYWRLKQPY